MTINSWPMIETWMFVFKKHITVERLGVKEERKKKKPTDTMDSELAAQGGGGAGGGGGGGRERGTQGDRQRPDPGRWAQHNVRTIFGGTLHLKRV